MSDKEVSDGGSWFDRFAKHGDTSGHASPSDGKGKRKRKDKDKEATPATVKEASHKFWLQFTWSSVISMQINIILVVILLVWLAKSAGDMVTKTETNTTNLVKGLQSSSQAFQASQAKARQSLISSQAALTRSQAEKNLQQALAAQKQLALLQSQQATQRQQTHLANAEANLAAQQARSAAAQAAALQANSKP